MNYTDKVIDYTRKECSMCKKIIDNTSNYITIPYYKYQSCEKAYIFFHRFCYFNYRTEILK